MWLAGPNCTRKLRTPAGYSTSAAVVCEGVLFRNGYSQLTSGGWMDQDQVMLLAGAVRVFLFCRRS